jgi:hypothetical protein
MYANKSTFTVWLAMQTVETYELQETKSCKVIKRKLTKFSDKFASYKSINEYLTEKKFPQRRKFRICGNVWRNELENVLLKNIHISERYFALLSWIYFLKKLC